MNNLFLKVSILSASILLIIALITYFKIDEVYALHNWPELPLGTFGCK